MGQRRIYIYIYISATALARKRGECRCVVLWLASVLRLSPGSRSWSWSWVLGAGLLVFLKGHAPPRPEPSPRLSRYFLRVFFFHRLFDPLLRTRASRKEYSDELGSQNDSKMEVKSEPGHQTAAGANLSQTLPGMSGLHVDPFFLHVFFLLFGIAFWSDSFCYKIVDSASQDPGWRSQVAWRRSFFVAQGPKKLTPEKL